MSQIPDIVKSLRFQLRDWNGKNRFAFSKVNALTISEAAATLEALSRRVDELEAALGEIAEFTTPLGRDGRPDYAVTVGTMRYAARAALKEKNDA